MVGQESKTLGQLKIRKATHNIKTNKQKHIYHLIN
jgi:hypothetical protein